MSLDKRGLEKNNESLQSSFRTMYNEYVRGFGFQPTLATSEAKNSTSADTLDKETKEWWMKQLSKSGLDKHEQQAIYLYFSVFETPSLSMSAATSMASNDKIQREQKVLDALLKYVKNNASVVERFSHLKKRSSPLKLPALLSRNKQKFLDQSAAHKPKQDKKDSKTQGTESAHSKKRDGEVAIGLEEEELIKAAIRRSLEDVNQRSLEDVKDPGKSGTSIMQRRMADDHKTGNPSKLQQISRIIETIRTELYGDAYKVSDADDNLIERPSDSIGRAKELIRKNKDTFVLKGTKNSTLADSNELQTLLKEIFVTMPANLSDLISIVQTDKISELQSSTIDLYDAAALYLYASGLNEYVNWKKALAIANGAGGAESQVPNVDWTFDRQSEVLAEMAKLKPRDPQQMPIQVSTEGRQGQNKANGELNSQMMGDINANHLRAIKKTLSELRRYTNTDKSQYPKLLESWLNTTLKNSIKLEVFKELLESFMTFVPSRLNHDDKNKHKRKNLKHLLEEVHPILLKKGTKVSILKAAHLLQQVKHKIKNEDYFLQNLHETNSVKKAFAECLMCSAKHMHMLPPKTFKQNLSSFDEILGHKNLSNYADPRNSFVQRGEFQGRVVGHLFIALNEVIKKLGADGITQEQYDDLKDKSIQLLERIQNLENEFFKSSPNKFNDAYKIVFRNVGGLGKSRKEGLIRAWWGIIGIAEKKTPLKIVSGFLLDMGPEVWDPRVGEVSPEKAALFQKADKENGDGLLMIFFEFLLENDNPKRAKGLLKQMKRSFPGNARVQHFETLIKVTAENYKISLQPEKFPQNLKDLIGQPEAESSPENTEAQVEYTSKSPSSSKSSLGASDSKSSKGGESERPSTRQATPAPSFFFAGFFARPKPSNSINGSEARFNASLKDDMFGVL